MASLWLFLCLLVGQGLCYNGFEYDCAPGHVSGAPKADVSPLNPPDPRSEAMRTVDDGLASVERDSGSAYTDSGLRYENKDVVENYLLKLEFNDFFSFNGEKGGCPLFNSDSDSECAKKFYGIEFDSGGREPDKFKQCYWANGVKGNGQLKDGTWNNFSEASAQVCDFTDCAVDNNDCFLQQAFRTKKLCRQDPGNGNIWRPVWPTEKTSADEIIADINDQTAGFLGGRCRQCLQSIGFGNRVQPEEDETVKDTATYCGSSASTKINKDVTESCRGSMSVSTESEDQEYLVNTIPITCGFDTNVEETHNEGTNNEVKPYALRDYLCYSSDFERQHVDGCPFGRTQVSNCCRIQSTTLSVLMEKSPQALSGYTRAINSISGLPTISAEFSMCSKTWEVENDGSQPDEDQCSVSATSNTDALFDMSDFNPKPRWASRFNNFPGFYGHDGYNLCTNRVFICSCFQEDEDRRRLLFGSTPFGSTPTEDEDDEVSYSVEASNGFVMTGAQGQQAWQGGGPKNVQDQSEHAIDWTGRCLQSGCDHDEFKGFYFANHADCSVESEDPNGDDNLMDEANFEYYSGTKIVKTSREHFCAKAFNCGKNSDNWSNKPVCAAVA